MGSRRERERTVKDYQSYTTADGRSLAQYAVDLLARGAPEADREADDILWQLATLVPDALLDIQMELVQREVVYPGFLFRGANPLVRDELIRRVLTADLPSLQRSHLLSALAWVGDPVVQRLFARFRHSPPPWRRDLFVPPEDYALEAGWHLKTSDERRDLAFSTCYELTSNTDSLEVVSPVTAITLLEATCDWCGMNLVTLLDLDLRSAALSFLGLAGERLRIAFCERCSYEGIVYTAVDLLGGSRWSGHSRPPKFIHPSDPYQPWPRRPLVLGQRRRTPIEANLLERYGLVGVSQMGGYPSWIQDAEHPMCPECQRPMSFVGQVAWGDIAVAEGITYAFVCVDCGMAATNYQQT